MYKTLFAFTLVFSSLFFGCSQESEMPLESDDVDVESTELVQGETNMLIAAEELFQDYLDRYISSDVDPRQELKQYEINNIEFRSGNDLEFTFFVDYSVQTPVSVTGTEVLTDWVAGNGELDEDGWVRHKTQEVTVVKQGEEYLITNMGQD